MDFIKLGDICTINPRLPKGTDDTQLVSFVTMSDISTNGTLLNQENKVLNQT